LTRIYNSLQGKKGHKARLERCKEENDKKRTKQKPTTPSEGIQHSVLKVGVGDSYARTTGNSYSSLKRLRMETREMCGSIEH
jgi:hypothetical protein